MAKRIEYKSQIELPTAADNDKNAIRKQEFDAHVNNITKHLPSDGQIGQVLVMTAIGLAWKYPNVACSCGTGSITFVETAEGMRMEGVDFNAVREVVIQ